MWVVFFPIESYRYHVGSFFFYLFQWSFWIIAWADWKVSDCWVSWCTYQNDTQTHIDERDEMEEHVFLSLHIHFNLYIFIQAHTLVYFLTSPIYLFTHNFKVIESRARTHTHLLVICSLTFYSILFAECEEFFMLFVWYVIAFELHLCQYVKYLPIHTKTR